jgi:hypothetical protein
MAKKRPILYGPDNRPIVSSVDEKSTESQKPQKQKQKEQPNQKQLVARRAKALRSLWSRVPRSLWGGLVLVTLVITLLEGYPWLSVEEGASLDSQNPLRTLFSVTNDGYLPVTKLDAACAPNYEGSGGIHISRNTHLFPEFADYLAHSGRATLPCFKVIDLPTRKTIDADLTVIISYSVWPVAWRFLRRHQAFRFKTIEGNDGQLHWAYVN